MPALTRASILGCVLIAGLGYYLAGNNPLEPSVWDTPHELPTLSGALTPNTALRDAHECHRGLLIGPESFAFDDAEHGHVFTGTSDGLIWELNAAGINEGESEPRILLFIGGILDALNDGTPHVISTDDAVPKIGPYHVLMENCRLMAHNDSLRHDKMQERKCGRPLGLEWVDGTLYVLDAYHGLFGVETRGNTDGSLKVVHLYISSNNDSQHQPIGPSGIPTAPAFLNNLEVVADKGVIFMTDSSWKNTRQQNREEILDAAPRGRLLRYDMSQGKVETVLCGLRFPNGILLSRGDAAKHLLIVESMRFRILHFSLAELLQMDELGPEECNNFSQLPQGARVWVSGIPGFADNITFDEKTGTYLLGIGTKVAKPFSLLYISLMHKWLRNLIGMVIPMWFIEHLVPKYGMVIAINLLGQISASFHAPSGQISLISEAMRCPHSGVIFLGSSQNPYLGYLG